MVEIFIDQVLSVVLPQNLYLASEIVVRTSNKLVLTNVPVLLHVLAQDLGPAFIIALNDLEQASFVMRLEILEHDHGCALVVRAHDPSIDTAHSVLL